MTDTQESLFFLLPPLEGGTKGGFQQRDFSGFIRGSLFLPLIPRKTLFLPRLVLCLLHFLLLSLFF